MTIKQINPTYNYSGISILKVTSIRNEPSTKIAYSKFKKQHISEKDRLSKLNDKFKEYLSRVKLLEDVNKKLTEAIIDAKKKAHSNSDLSKKNLQKPLDELKESLNKETERKVLAQIKQRQFLYVSELVKQKSIKLEQEYNKSKQKLSSLESYNEKLKEELEFLKSKANNANKDVNKYKSEIVNLTKKLDDLNATLDKQILERLNFQVDTQRLVDEIAFAKSTHSCIRDELSKNAESTAQINQINFYKSELNQSIQQIKQDFECMMEAKKEQISDYYDKKLKRVENELKTRNKPHENDENLITEFRTLSTVQSKYLTDIDHQKQINSALDKKFNELKFKLENLRKDNEDSLQQKDAMIENLKKLINEQSATMELDRSSIDSEINLYKRLLDTHYKIANLTNNNNNNTQAPVPKPEPKKEKEVKFTEDTLNNEKPKLAFGKIKNLREVKGPVGIREVSLDAKCIVIENLSEHNDYNIGEWFIKRNIDNQPKDIVFILPKDARLNKRSRINLWSGSLPNNKIQPSSEDIVNTSNLKDWGVGNIVVTKLFDREAKLKSIHTQKNLN